MTADRAAMLIDVSKCMGCRGCQVACKQWNQLPAEKTKFTGTYQNPPELSAKTWTLVSFNETDDDPPKWLFAKRQCLHCGEAACLEVCPTGAIRRSEQGIVYIEQSVCAGCKYCVETCPFSTPHADHDTGTARKCWMCLDRVSNGMKPACVTACPTGALQFGRRTDLLTAAKERVAVLKANGSPNARLYGENELGGLGAMYVLTDVPSAFGLIENPTLPHRKIMLKWLLGIIPGLALMVGVFAYLRKSAKAQAKGGE
jgi:formate dehydrogenase iron-sulfur subunit